MSKVKDLQRENKELEKHIHSENDEIYTNMIVNLRGSNASLLQQEIVRNDIAQMMLDAQERGQTAKDVFGKNPEAVTQEIMAELPSLSTKEILLQRFLQVLQIFCIMMFIYIVRDTILYGIGRLVEPMLTLTFGDIVNMVLIGAFSVGLVNYIIRTSWNEETNKEKIVVGLLFALFILLFFASSFFLNVPMITLSLLHALLVIGILLILYVFLSKTLDNMQENKFFKKS